MPDYAGLRGKVAVVTGGANGIGRACVEAFLAAGEQLAHLLDDVAAVVRRSDLPTQPNPIMSLFQPAISQQG
jgi:NAD(P)-dependent dehydrogenase (short-subunit alcohol dehydrogenase family)